MTNRMLINATQEEEIRVAIVDGSRLDNLDIEIRGKEQQKGSVHFGIITRIERSLEAVFVNYGAERHGFLPFREISRIYHKDSNNDNGSIADKLRVGQEVIIQVEKEARGTKGAALTTYVSLAGCYLVLMPNNPKAGGISRRIDGEEREELREVLNQLNIPTDMGVIVRTAGMGRDIKDLQWDLDVLIQQWNAIEKAVKGRPAPFLIYQESSLIVRAIRDHLRPDINEILIDSLKVFEEARKHIEMTRPDFASRLKLYNGDIPLFSRFQIESQIEMAFQREVNLPSGGAIVIDHTEALISIDINSAKATRGGDIEETAYHTNLEAAEEIARQLRLRDIGGLIVIDFIDMSVVKNQKAVEQRLKEALVMDRARVQVGRISRFGLLEMSRQRLRPALSASRDIICPRCVGQGTIKSVEVLALNMIRLLEEEAIKDSTAQIQVELPVEVATYLINEKRQAILDIERKHHIRLILIPSNHLATPNYNLKRVKKEDLTLGSEERVSYSLSSKPEVAKNQYDKAAINDRHGNNVPAVAQIDPSMVPQKPGIIRRFLTTILGNDSASAANEAEQDTTPTFTPNRNTRFNQQRPNNNNRRTNNNNRSRTPNPNPRPSQQQPRKPQHNHAEQEQKTITVAVVENVTNAAETEQAVQPPRNPNAQRRRKMGGRRNQYRKERNPHHEAGASGEVSTTTENSSTGVGSSKSEVE